jgi:hypothetical protein
VKLFRIKVQGQSTGLGRLDLQMVKIFEKFCKNISSACYLWKTEKKQNIVVAFQIARCKICCVTLSESASDYLAM